MMKNLFKKLFSFGKKPCCADKADCCHFEKTLSSIASGQSVQIESLRGEAATCQRLREMGFCESATVEKVTDSGALICKVCDAKVVISKGLAQNIIVKEICHAKDSKA